MRLKSITESADRLAVSLELKEVFDGKRYDAPEEGIVRRYRVSLRDQNGKELSYVQLLYSDGTGIARTSDLHTIEGERGKGYATYLYQEMVKQARDIGIKELYSDTNRSPQTSRIWKRLGATQHRAPEGFVYRLDLSQSR